VKSVSRAELAELHERADRAIKEARELRENHCFILSWLLMRPALKVRRTSLLLDEACNMPRCR